MPNVRYPGVELSSFCAGVSDSQLRSDVNTDTLCWSASEQEGD